MTIPITARRGFLIDSEPVCDRCGHGQGLHARGADVECVACIERGEGRDCPSYASFGSTWGGPWSRGRESVPSARETSRSAG